MFRELAYKLLLMLNIHRVRNYGKYRSTNVEANLSNKKIKVPCADYISLRFRYCYSGRLKQASVERTRNALYEDFVTDDFSGPNSAVGQVVRESVGVSVSGQQLLCKEMAHARDIWHAGSN